MYLTYTTRYSFKHMLWLLSLHTGCTNKKVKTLKYVSLVSKERSGRRKRAKSHCFWFFFDALRL